ncbi:hypothetical protein [Chryseobacterium vrystaatense]|uniref:Knr4/Smi1-like domain-containing protein n=1 Tax=Chryseobacterium vrystaatense TaxID=307480 RepID=A0A1M4Z3S1_9FLAO|nr:hypothetical protein [Chryseobacterium vrystaatense]KFF27349.1 hypothetical protein IW16_08895 [Chryseobacterium vrystaatense]SHF12681.1 hypothetical protein SAMN02787073_1476 [Chryseobacterium vrystaatense]
MHIPEDLTDFLYWIKDRTETIWSVEDENYCPKGFYGAKWHGLTDDQIDDVEIKYNVKFTSDHRTFLRILHAVDKKEIVEYEDEGKLVTEECTFFYNWLDDEDEILKTMNEPYEGMWQDTDDINRVWLKSWGVKPKYLEKRKEIFDEWFSKLQKLLPVRGTRFVVDNNGLIWSPVVSVSGSDVVVIGWDFRTYLLYELRNHLDIYMDVFDEEDQRFYPEFIDEVRNIFDENYKCDDTKDIPYLKEMSMYWSSGWRSFGLDYYPEDAKVHPIVKTYIAEEEK